MKRTGNHPNLGNGTDMECPYFRDVVSPDFMFRTGMKYGVHKDRFNFYARKEAKE